VLCFFVSSFLSFYLSFYRSFSFTYTSVHVGRAASVDFGAPKLLLRRQQRGQSCSRPAGALLCRAFNSQVDEQDYRRARRRKQKMQGVVVVVVLVT
jgi:hypothetical protein